MSCIIFNSIMINDESKNISACASISKTRKRSPSPSLAQAIIRSIRNSPAPNTQSRLVSRCAPSSGIRAPRQAQARSPTLANELEYSPICQRPRLENVSCKFFLAISKLGLRTIHGAQNKKSYFIR